MPLKLCTPLSIVTSARVKQPRKFSSISGGLQDLYPFEGNQTIARGHLTTSSTCTMAYVFWIRRPGLEADHSPQSNADFKNKRSYASASPYVFMLEVVKILTVFCNFRAGYKPRLCFTLWLISFI